MGRDVHFPFIAFVHACKGDLPAHDEVAYHEQRRKLVPFGGVEDGSVNQPARVMYVDDAAGRGLLGAVAFFKDWLSRPGRLHWLPCRGWFFSFSSQDANLRLFPGFRACAMIPINDTYNGYNRGIYMPAALRPPPGARVSGLPRRASRTPSPFHPRTK